MVHKRYLSFVLFAWLVAAVAGCSSSEDSASDSTPEKSVGEATETQAAESVELLYPRPIILVTPKPGAEICLPASIDVRFKLNNAMVINGRHDPTAFDMLMDGKSVLREVEFFPSQAFPQTHVAMLHAMWVYDPGPHTVRVEFVGDDGDTHYEWQFTIKEGCPKPNF
jgi:hypothetical protein